jgi:hypothetical protein
MAQHKSILHKAYKKKQLQRVRNLAHVEDLDHRKTRTRLWNQENNWKEPEKRNKTLKKN